MDIKKSLRDMNIKLFDLAEILMISRPTLNTYIKLFEDGETIPNDKYHKIFTDLFNSGDLNQRTFEKKLSRYQKLLIRDSSLGLNDLDIKRTNLMSMIIKSMKKDITSEEYDEDIYIFVNYLFSSYQEQSAFKKLIDYFLYLNDLKDIEKINDDEKIFMSNCYKLMRNELDNALQFDQTYYDQFYDRIFELRESKKTISEKIAKNQESMIQEVINNILKSKIDEQLKLGVDIKDVNTRDIIENMDLNEIKSMLSIMKKGGIQKK